MIDQHHGWYKSFKPLAIGYTLSLLLIVAAYRFLTQYHLTHTELIIALFSFCIVQALIQLIFFMHLGIESKPRWNLITFLFTVLVLVIIVGGSIWIMENLEYNLMPTGGY
ncbi:MAG: Cytochrome bo(3) ubiquinol oxidase subunit 4 [Chlamydiae bacterium]|nr:Cytochrome bo(3) ubiquinol oxidase subunit 4 [Chlamydiota bacterium]